MATPHGPHPGIGCDVCGEAVVGLRWKCAHSEESYDLCDGCHGAVVAEGAAGGTGPRAFLRLACPMTATAATLWRPSAPYSYAVGGGTGQRSPGVGASSGTSSREEGCPAVDAPPTLPAPGTTCAACGAVLFVHSDGAAADSTALTSATRAAAPWACGACVARGTCGTLFAPGEVLLELWAPVVVLDAGSPDVVPAGTVAVDVGGEADPLVPPAHLACLTPGDAQGRTPDELAVACFGSVDALSTAVHAGVACDVCGVGPLVGPRLVRCDVENYDLCWPCFVKGPGEGRPPAAAPFILLSRCVYDV